MLTKRLYLEFYKFQCSFEETVEILLEHIKKKLNIINFEYIFYEKIRRDDTISTCINLFFQDDILIPHQNLLKITNKQYDYFPVIYQEKAKHNLNFFKDLKKIKTNIIKFKMFCNSNDKIFIGINHKEISIKFKKFERRLKKLTDLTNKKKVVVVKKKKTNYKIGHDFEKIIVKLLNNNGFIAQLVSCRPGDFGSDIFVSYKKNLIIIQCKNQMSKIGIDVIQRMQSASIGHFKDSLGVIVYNNKKLKSNPLTKDASTWHQSVCSEILVVDEKH